MAIFETHQAPAKGGLSHGIFTALFATLTTSYNDWRERRETRVALLQLTDRQLDDIGLTRGDLERSL